MSVRLTGTVAKRAKDPEIEWWRFLQSLRAWELHKLSPLELNAHDLFVEGHVTVEDVRDVIHGERDLFDCYVEGQLS